MATVHTLPRRTTDPRTSALRSQCAHAEALLRRTYDAWQRGLMIPEDVCTALETVYAARQRFAEHTLTRLA